MTLKILMISNAAPSKQHPYSGIFIYNTINVLKKNGQKIDWIHIKKDLKKYRIIKIMKYVYLYFKTIIFFLFYKYDIIHIHFISHTGLLGLLLKKIKPKVPLVINFHGSDLFSSREIPIQSIISNADLLISPSTIFLNKIKKKYEINIPYYIYPSGGIDCDLFYPYKINSKTNSEFHLGYVSRLTERKGIWDFIYALEKLNFPKIKIIAHIIGIGPETDRVKDYIKHNKGKIDFNYHGSINHKELPKFYNKFDLFIFPTKRSDSESLGLVALEALACGIPIIGTDIPITKLYIKDGYNGFIYKKGNINSLTNCLQKYYKMESNLKDQMKSNSREIALNFEKNKVTKKLINKYKDIL